MSGSALYKGRNFKKPLSSEEQNKLLELVRQGNQSAKNLIIEHNLGLIMTVINRHFNKFDDETKEDLFSIGCMGLVKAVNDFNPDFGCEFSTYAVPMIHGEIKRYLRDNSSVMHVSRSIKDLAYNIINFQKQYSNKHNGQELSIEELAKVFDVPKEDIILAISANLPVESMNTVIYTSKKDDKELTLSDTIPDLNATTHTNIEKKELYEDLVQAINGLPDRDKKIITLYFGLGCQRKTQVEIGEIIGLSQAQITREIKRITSNLKRILPDYIKEEYEPKAIHSITPKKGKETHGKRSTIYNIFTEYTKEDIDEVLETLSEEEKNLVLLKYPYVLDKQYKVSFKNQAIELGLDYISVTTKINKIIRLLKPKLIEKKYGIKINAQNNEYKTINKTKSIKSIFSYYPNNTEEEVLKEINNLNNINKTIMELRYGLNGNTAIGISEIARKLELTSSIVTQRIAYCKTSIKKSLDNKNNNLTNSTTKTEITNIFKLFPNYPETDILKAIDSLKEINKKIIELKYGLNGNRVHTTKEISELLNINYSTLTVRIVNIRQSISRHLEDPTLDQSKTKDKNIKQKKEKKQPKTIFEWFPEYTEEQIIQAINSLNETNKKIVELRYGLNGNAVHSIKEISELIDIEYSKVNNKIITARKSISKLLENKQIRERNKNIFELFPDYTEEEIIRTINLLNDLNKKIIELRFGLNGNNITSIADIATVLNMNPLHISQHIVYSKKQIKKLLVNPKKNKENKKKTVSTRAKSIFDVLPGYTEEQILQAINSLNETNKKIVELRYGLNGNKIHSIKEIVELFNTDYNKINNKLINIRKSIKNLLENKPIRNKCENIFDLFPDYTEEQILQAINLLNDINKKIIELRFGLNGNNITSIADIATVLNMNPLHISQHIVYSKKQIKKLLVNPKKNKENKKKTVSTRAKSIFDVLPGYTEEQILRAINSLNETNKKIIELRYGLNGNKVHSIKEISELLDINYASVNNRIVNCKKRISNLLDNKTKSKQNQNILELFPGYTEEQILRAINSLNDENITILELKFGLNGIKAINNKEIAEKLNINYSKLVSKINYSKKIIDRILKAQKFYYNVGERTEIIKNETKIETLNIEEKEEIKVPISITNIAFTNGTHLLSERKFVEAEKEFKKALSSDKRFILQKSNYYLGRIFLAKGKPIIAEKYLRSSLKFENCDYDTILLLGKALTSQQKYDEADKCYSRCSEIKPHSTIHIIEKGKNYKAQGNFEKAEKIFDLVIKKRPTDYTAYLEEGKMFFELRKFDKAKQVLNVCESLLPQKPQHKAILGKIYYLDGRNTEAKKLFEECVQINLLHNNIYQIVDIGYFFHAMGDKDSAYEYYLKAPVFKKWVNLPEYEVKKHIETHTKNNANEQMHSIFSFPVSLEMLQKLIEDMEKTTTREMYDIYQIHCKGAGIMIIDEDKKEIEDYITICTLPFTKKIMMSYPDKQMPNTQIEKTVSIEDLLETPVIIEPKKLVSEDTNNVNIEKIDNKQSEKVEGIIITDKTISPFNKDFEHYKDKFKMLINMLTDSTEQIILLLRLGYIKDKYYSEQEIGEFLNINEQEVHSIITSALNNINNIASLTNLSIESAKNQLELTK